MIKHIFMVLLQSVIAAMSMVGNQVGGVGVDTPNALPSNSKKRGWDTRLQAKSRWKSIFSDMMGEYSTETKKLPNAVMMDIPSTNKSDTDVTITVLLPLAGTGTFTGVLVGNEEQIRTLTGKVYREECRHAVTTSQYGSDYLETEAYKLYSKVDDLLGDWNKDELDLECHQALQETYGETLYHNSTAAICVPNFNRNTMVLGFDKVSDAAVTYSSNPATYTTNIVAKMVAAGSGSLTPTSNQILDKKQLGLAKQFCLRRHIQQLDIPGLPGGKGWIVLISEVIAELMRNSQWTSNNLGSLWKDTVSMNEKLLKYDGVIGYYEKFLFIEDLRAATFLPGGSGEPYSAVTGYVWHGDNDQRNLDEDNVREAIPILGKAALWRNTPEPIHFINQMDDYGKVKGVGTACVRGIGSLVYDQETPGVGTSEQYSSAIMYAPHLISA